MRPPGTWWPLAPHVTIMCIMVMLLCFHHLQVVAGFECLSNKCECLYKRNKLHAECGSRGIVTTLPRVEEEEGKEKDSRKDIQILNLTQNTFTSLKSNIFYSANLINLQRIYLRKVGLESVDKAAFFKLINLVELDLSKNSLKEVPSHCFSSITKLRDLDLSGNLISLIEDDAFSSLSNLKTLSLERNVIKFIGLNAFNSLSILETLKLSDNQLSFLDSKSFFPIERVHSLTLSGNPWNCNCQLRQLRSHLLHKKLSVYDQPKCSEPAARTWTQMDLNSFICAPMIVANVSRISSPLNSIVVSVKQGSPVAMECSFFMAETNDLDSQALPVKWVWQDRQLTNDSKGLVSGQLFTIHEFTRTHIINSSNKTVKVSRLEISLVLEMNHGLYTCSSVNEAGFASNNFTLTVLPGAYMAHNGNGGSQSSSSADQSPAAEASLNQKNKQNDLSADSSETQATSTKHKSVNSSPGTESMVYGLMIGILVGIVLVLVTLSTAVIVLCRRKSMSRRRRVSSSSLSFNHSNNTKNYNSSSDQTLDHLTATYGMAVTEAELEKLTPSSLTSSQQSNPHVSMTMSHLTQERLGHHGSHLHSHTSDCSDSESGFYHHLPLVHGRGHNGLMAGHQLLQSEDGNSSIYSGSLVNPIQKPPRITFSSSSNQIDVPAASTPQVWLIKRSSTSTFGGDHHDMHHQACFDTSGDPLLGHRTMDSMSMCPTPSLIHDSHNYNDHCMNGGHMSSFPPPTFINEPDLIHHPMTSLGMTMGQQQRNVNPGENPMTLSPANLYGTKHNLDNLPLPPPPLDQNNDLKLEQEPVNLSEAEGIIV